MNICVVGPSKQFFSGLAVHTVLLSNALSKQSEVSVILLKNLVPSFLYPGREWIGQATPLVDFDSGIDVFEGMDWNSPLSWIRAHRFLKKHKPDAIIMLWWSSAVAHMLLFLAMANKMDTRSKLLLEMHEVVDPFEETIMPIRLYSRVAGKLVMRSADAFTVHSTAVKGQVVQTYGITKEKIFVKPFGVYGDYYQDYDKGLARKELEITENLVLLCFGSIRKYKGISVLVKAFSDLPESIANSTRLLIAGEDWADDNELLTLIESSPYRHRIEVHPQLVPEEMIPVYFSAADIVVLPYLRTAGSGVANIAMAYGKPIITSELDTMKELLAAYSGASFVPAGDSTALKLQLMRTHEEHVSGNLGLYSPPDNTWEEISVQYQMILKQLGGTS